MRQILLFLPMVSISFFLFSQEIQNEKRDTLPATQQVMDLPTISLSDGDVDGDSQSHDISSLLQGSRDIFTNTAGFTFGSARFRIRGYDSENFLTTINGVPMNDPETGRVFYGTWGGLNNVTRFTDGHNNLGVSQYGFGGLGGTTNIEMRASRFGPTIQTTYSLANRSYVHRAMFTYSTGVKDGKWALVMSGSRRYASEGYVKGTFYDAWSFFISGERIINPKHSIGIVGFGAPSVSGRPGVAVQEAYDLVGDNFYNPNWGYQNGEVRNSRINNFHNQTVIFSHYWKPSFNTEINTSAAFGYGRGGSTALNWYHSQVNYGDLMESFYAGDPRPDYYRRLPSFYGNNPASQTILADRWKNDPTVSQLNWDWMYNANYNNTFAVNNANGTTQTTVGNRSKYIIEDRRNDRTQFLLSNHFNHRPNPRNKITGGFNVSSAKFNQFKTIDDLLGGDFWLDIDQFAERDFEDPTQSQNDLSIFNKTVTKGGKFGYNFTGNVNKYDAFLQSEWILPRWDLYIGAMASQTTFWRTGHMQNGRFPDNSLGDGEKHNFTDFGAKGGITYKITGRHYLTANSMYQTRAPYFRDAYISSRVRDGVIEGLQSETMFAGDLSYIIRSPKIKSRITAFYTEFKDQTWSRSFYHEAYRAFVNYIMTGVDTKHMGIEFGMDINLSSTLAANLAFGTGEHIYNSRPNVTIVRDNDQERIADGETVYLQNYKIGGMTHTAGSVGLRYNSPKFWFIGTNANYFADIFVDINPDRRTEKAVENLVPSDPQWNQVLGQEKLPSGFTFDIFAGYSYRTSKRHFINFNISVNNLLNTKDFKIGGFENLRYDSHDPNKFANRYFYMYGRTFFLNISYRI
jgi:hypothetical protein